MFPKPLTTACGRGCEGHRGENDEAAVGGWGVTAQSPTAGYKTGLTHTAEQGWDGHTRVERWRGRARTGSWRRGAAARAVRWREGTHRWLGVGVIRAIRAIRLIRDSDNGLTTDPSHPSVRTYLRSRRQWVRGGFRYLGSEFALGRARWEWAFARRRT